MSMNENEGSKTVYWQGQSPTFGLRVSETEVFLHSPSGSEAGEETRGRASRLLTLTALS